MATRLAAYVYRPKPAEQPAWRRPSSEWPLPRSWTAWRSPPPPTPPPLPIRSYRGGRVGNRRRGSSPPPWRLSCARNSCRVRRARAERGPAEGGGGRESQREHPPTHWNCHGPRHNKYAKNRRLFLAACHAHLMYDAKLRGERLAATAVCVCGDGGGTRYIPPPPSIMDATARGPRCRGAAHRERAVSGPWSKETSSS